MADLRIELLGAFRVTAGARAVPEEAWRRRRPAALVKLLALAPGHRLHREQAMDALWPELDPQAAAANLRKAVHHARRSLDLDDGTGLTVSAGELLCLPSGRLVDRRRGMRVLDSLELTATHKVATPVDWTQGEDVIITTTVSDEEAAERFPGYVTVKLYLRTTPTTAVRGGVIPEEIYSTGTWRPSPGKEEAFVEAWAEFAAWASGRPGAGTLRLTRDTRGGGYLSFGRWSSVEAVRAWKSAPDFRERLAQVLQHVDDFEPTELEVVATAESGAAAADLVRAGP